MITPHKKPTNGELSEAAKEANKSINRIRQVVERTIARIKSWRIHPHRLPAPPAHIRADHHRRTLTPRLQNHRLNKLHNTSSNRLAIAAPSGIGTALPICLAMAVREPMKRWLSGKPWSRAAS